MTNLQKIPYQKAISLWNSLLSLETGIVPFSFNPSLFNFYQKHYNWKPYYLFVLKENKPVGLLPLVNTGKAWVSLPHFSYGGLFMLQEDCDYSLPSLYLKAIELTKDKEPGFYNYFLDSSDDNNASEKIFIRSIFNSNGALQSEKQSSILFLPENIESLWSGIGSNLRRKIRKADGIGIRFEFGGIELLTDFYSVYTKNIRNLNSVNYSKKFFADLINIWDINHCSIVVAYFANKPIGSALLNSYNDFYENTYFATIRAFRKHYISDLMHWEMIKHVYKTSESSESQVSKRLIYSFGRSTVNSGVYKYKNHWPVENFPIYTYINFPDVRRSNLLNKLWSYIPAAITKPLGARLIKHIY